jgi:hypothetical protein
MCNNRCSPRSPYPSSQTRSGSVNVPVPAPPANEDLVMISCKTSEAAEKADSSNPESGEGIIIVINSGIMGVMSLMQRVKLKSERNV